MADIITGTVSGVVDTSTLQSEHADIRREAAVDAALVTQAVKDSSFDVNMRSEAGFDRVGAAVAMTDSKNSDRFFDVARDTADLRAQVIQVLSEAKLIGAAVAKDTEISVLKNTIEGQKNTQYLSDKIGADGDRTRSLLNDLKYHDLNRHLVERNSELVEERAERRHYRDRADQSQVQGQWAAVQSQIQAFASQLQDVKQGTVNFGTMSGNAGRNTATNNVA